MDFTSQHNVSETWRRWKRGMEYYLAATCKVKNEAEKVAIFMCMIGRDGQEIKDTFEFEVDEDGSEVVSTAILFNKFEAHCKPRKNLVVDRHRFLTRDQASGESIDQYVTELRTLAAACEWGELKDDLICSRIVSGISSRTVRERLLRESQLSLKRAVEICRVAELSKEQLKLFGSEANVSQVKHRASNRPQHKGSADKPQETKKFTQRQQDNTRAVCGNCGSNHPKGQCPAFGKKCNKCKRLNHYAKMCRSSKNVNSIQQDEGNEDHLFLESVSVTVESIDRNRQSETEHVKLTLNNQEICLKLDTGAEVNVIPYSAYRKIAETSKIDLRKPKARLSAYNGEDIPVKAVCTLQSKHKGITRNLEFFITSIESEPVLSISACKELGLIKFISAVDRDENTETFAARIREEYKDVFTGIGCLERPYHIVLDPEVQPVINPPRRVPYGLQDRVKAALDEMCNQGIIVPVDQPTDWVNSMVAVEKKNTDKLRICIDPRPLNKAIKREHYHLPTIEEITTRLSGAKFFSTLDARSGFWQIPLDDESSTLTTFATPYGRYRFTRMPFGIHSAQEVFHKRLHELFQDLSGVETDIDDILVWGRTREEHDERLEKTLQRARESNLKLNPDKCKIRRSEVLYIGHVLTTDGVKPDVSKLEAITSMPTPEDKHGIQRLLGMVNYVAKFLPNISEVTSPLRELLKKDVAWHWTERHEQSFNDIKKLLTETSKGVLKYYDPKQPVGLQVDACKSGLGAVLMQGGSPIAYASRSLTETECKYAQIEKELLAVVFGCERFHQYIYAKEVTVETDHRPLVSIITKSLDKAPARLQRMLLRLQRYNIDLQYKPGKELYTADTLSRAHLPTTGDEDEDLVLYVHNMTANLPVSDKKLVELLRETANDKIMVKLIETIQEGWPKHRQNTSKQVREYWPIKDELHVSDGLIFKGESIVVPQALRKDVLAQIHEGHLGIERSKQRARELVFWPGMSKQIEDTVANCSICQELRNSNTKEPMIPHEIPQYPWQIAATDLFTWNGGNYIVVVDYYSRYWEVSSLHNTTSTSVIEKLKQFFARHGIPETLKSDNGPQYSSAEFAKFAAVWKFSHVTSSPKYPQSNGLAEKTVQTVKRTLEKAKRDGKDPYLAMLEQRNTPVGNYKSPAQLSMARRLRSILPCTTSHLLPETTSHQETMVRFQKKQAEQKANYDRSATPLPSLHTGETVRIQRDGDWKPAKVIEVADTPRSYRVETPDGAVYRRNRKHLHQDKSASPKVDTGETDTQQRDEQSTGVERATGVSELQDEGHHTRSGRLIKKPTRLGFDD